MYKPVAILFVTEIAAMSPLSAVARLITVPFRLVADNRIDAPLSAVWKLLMKSKPLSQALVLSLCSAALMFTASDTTYAATITSDGAQLGVNSVPTPLIGSQGYVFYGTTDGNVFTGASVASPVSYVSISGGNGIYGPDSSYSTLTINGSTVNTGVLYQSPVPEYSSGTIATVTLTAGTPNSFVLGILEDNASAAANNMSSLSVSSLNSATQSVAGNASGVSNDFYFFLVSNATPGDILTVSTTNNGFGDDQAHWVIGGLTFSTAPEPASVTLFGLGAVGFIVAARRRRRARTTRFVCGATAPCPSR